jgi:DNA-binding SARP family transcriptional activator
MGRLADGRRSRPRAGEVARGLAALLGILALVAGVPAALWLAVGWPLPHTLPTLAELREGLSRSAVPEELFPRALAVLAWVAWAQFMASVVVEARSALRGRAARRVPGAGWGTQRLASSLVTGALLLLPTEGFSAVALASASQRPLAVVRIAAPPAAAAGTLGLVADHQSEVTATGSYATTTSQVVGRRTAVKGPPRYEVKRRDTLWRIAERHLGDPLRWKEIFELNKGRTQPDGRALKEAHWIYPGWTLLLPPDAVGLPKPAGGTGRPGSAPAPHSAPKEPNAAQHGGTGTSRRPGPGGGGVVTPSTGGSVSAPTAPPLPSTAQAPHTTVTPEIGAEPPETTPSQRPPTPGFHVSLRNAGPLAAGILALLAVFRVVQQRRRRFRRRIAMPDEELVPVEAALRATEAPEVAELIDLGLRTMAAAVLRDGMEPPDVIGVLVGPDMLETLLATETPTAPEPFVLSHSRRRWGLPVDIPIQRLREAAGSTASPLPALVTLGATQNGLLLVNLESPGLIALGGDHDAGRAVLASFAVELATCRWADFLELILVGFGRELGRLERARVASSVMEVLPWLESKAGDVADLLGETQARSVLAGRVAGEHPDGWVPAVVLCAERPTPEEVTRLVALTAVPSRSPVVAVIAAGDVDGARFTMLLPEGPGEPVHVPEFRLEVVPQRLDPADYDAVSELFETTTRGDVPAEAPAWRPASQAEPPHIAADGDDDGSDGAGKGPDTTTMEPTTPARTEATERAGSPRTPRLHELRLTGGGALPGAEADEEPEVEVRVLGRIEIGGIERVERGKSEELIVYLALHPDGVDADQLSEALWPGRPPAKGTLNTTTAVARAYLGATPNGQPRLPHARNGIYRLDPSVGLDWTRFQTLATRGDTASQQGVGDLHRALELVRGRPFEAAKPRSYGWAQLDQAPIIEATIVDVADHLAGLLLQAGDHAGARWAARRGLVTAPYDERLYRRLLLAADAAGNPAGVEAVMDELLLRLDEENLEPYDTLHEETRTLYQQLTHQRPNSRKGNAG